jgi:hypothetical protein
MNTYIPTAEDRLQKCEKSKHVQLHQKGVQLHQKVSIFKLKISINLLFMPEQQHIIIILVYLCFYSQSKHMSVSVFSCSKFISAEMRTDQCYGHLL